jgi:tetratricopeptide (TPR) repeat protein
MKLYDKAIEEYNSCLVIDPKNSTALRDRSLAYQGKLLWDNAINDINAAISINPLQNQGLLDLGNLYYNKNEFEKALEYYEKAIVQDTKNPTIYNNMSASFIKLKLYDKAIHYADIVLDIDKNFQTALKHKAYALYHLGNNGDALINVSRAIELSSNYWEALYVRALVYKSLQVYTKSMEDVLVSLSFNDSDQDSIHLKNELTQILGLAASN